MSHCANCEVVFYYRAVMRKYFELLGESAIDR
jgi:hypothetical protein